MAMPPLGFIEPSQRTKQQADAHADAVSKMRAFSLAPVAIPVGTKIILTDFLRDPDAIADMGMQFPGFRQQTGACVGVTEGEITATLSAVQRKLADNPTKAFIPWWPFAYGRTRLAEGDRGQGEGAVSSVMGATLEKEGTFAPSEASGLPSWDTRDGLALTSSIEMQYSDGASPLNTKWLTLAATHTFGARAPVYDTQSVATAIANGYPVANGCAYYCSGGSLHGSGDAAYVQTQYSGRGGHETSWVGVWNHPTAGMLFLYWNHWDASTYPHDPASQLRCAAWQTEADVAKGLTNYIDRDEAFAVSHVKGFPAQVDAILDYVNI